MGHDPRILPRALLRGLVGPRAGEAPAVGGGSRPRDGLAVRRAAAAHDPVTGERVAGGLPDGALRVERPRVGLAGGLPNAALRAGRLRVSGGSRPRVGLAVRRAAAAHDPLPDGRVAEGLPGAALRVGRPRGCPGLASRG